MMPYQYADSAGRYRLDSRIATGGMGVVWRATDTRLDRPVAVKVLKDEFADDATFRTRFDTEARNAAALHHANIAGVFDYDADPEDRAPFLVMELVDGQPMSALLAEAKSAGRAFDPDVVRDLLGQAADGLAVAHRAGIVHRDVKPANLVVTPKGVVKVTDFGIARAADGVQITHTGSVMGTPQYLSPEQARGEAATPASDVYALGVVAFEALAGRRPFEADTPVATTLAHIQQPVPDLPGSVPADLARVVRRALDKEPSQRFADATAFAAALRNPSGMAPADESPTMRIAPTTVSPATQPTAPVTTSPPPDEDEEKSKPWGIILLVVLLIAAIALVAWLILGGSGEEEPPEESSQPTQSSSEPATPSTPPTTEEETEEPTTTAPATVTINASDYIDRDVTEVEAELRDLNLEVTLSEVANDGSQTEDAVTGVNPSGTVTEGSLITVTYYGPPPATSATPTETTQTPEEDEQ